MAQSYAFDRLPFVYWPGGDQRRRFWAPRPSGNYGFDCELGDNYGAAVLPLLREPGGHQLLRYIVCDIARRGELNRDTGVLIGMFGTIGKALEQP